MPRGVRSAGGLESQVMLAELRIRDLGVIDDARLEVSSGLNVLTGETGAGKTMVVDALSLLLGELADPGAVRVGREAAVAAVAEVVRPIVEVHGQHEFQGLLRPGVQRDLLDRFAGPRVLEPRAAFAAGRVPPATTPPSASWPPARRRWLSTSTTSPPACASTPRRCWSTPAGSTR